MKTIAHCISIVIGYKVEYKLEFTLKIEFCTNLLSNEVEISSQHIEVDLFKQ